MCVQYDVSKRVPAILYYQYPICIKQVVFLRVIDNSRCWFNCLIYLFIDLQIGNVSDDVDIDHTFSILLSMGLSGTNIEETRTLLSVECKKTQ